MERIPKGAYTPEFRAQAVRLIEEGAAMTEVSRQLSVPLGSLKKWLYAFRAGKLAEIGKHQKPLSEVELELARLKKELAEVKLERDLLKNVRRILRRSRGEIRPNRIDAAQLSNFYDVPFLRRFRKRVSCMADSPHVGKSSRVKAVGSSHQSSAPTDA